MNQRHKKLIDLLEENGEMPVENLAASLNVSECTIRRDLAQLESGKMLIRSFGGARLPGPTSLVVQAFEKRRTEMRHEKEIIARKAAEFVKPGMVVAIDSGTTSWRAAVALKDKTPLTVLTSALAPVEELGNVEGISIYCTGGNFRMWNLDFTGAQAVKAYNSLRADIALIACDGFIPDRGAFTNDTESAGIGQAVAACAQTIIVLIDHTKFNNIAPFQIIPKNKISCVITDSGIDRKTLSSLKKESYQLILCQS